MVTTLAPLPPPAPPPPVRTVPRLRRLRYEPEPGRPEAAPPPPRPIAPIAPALGPAEVAEARLGVAWVLRLVLEVFDGRRPPAHLDDRASPPVLRYLRAAVAQRRARAPAGARSPARPRRIRLCLVRPEVAEVAVACEIDGRVRAVAARFERPATGPTEPAGWRCTALRLG